MDINFKNGYAASLIDTGYGSNSGLYEIAVIFDDAVVYDTSITDDVLGFLTGEEVVLWLRRISELPERVS